MSDTTPKEFEQSIETLNNLVDKMQTGNLPLEESLEHFEQGIKLIKKCQKSLSEAEQRVQILTKENQLKEFDNTNEN